MPLCIRNGGSHYGELVPILATFVRFCTWVIAATAAASIARFRIRISPFFIASAVDHCVARLQTAQVSPGS